MLNMPLPILRADKLEQVILQYQIALKLASDHDVPISIQIGFVYNLSEPRHPGRNTQTVFFLNGTDT